MSHCSNHARPIACEAVEGVLPCWPAPTHPPGVQLAFYLKEQPDKKTVVKLSFHPTDATGQALTAIQTYSTKPDTKLKQGRLNAKAGMNRFAWNMRYPSAETFPRNGALGGGNFRTNGHARTLSGTTVGRQAGYGSHL